MASNSEAQVFSGARAKIRVADDVVGWAQGITWTIDHGLQPVVVVGSYKVKEHNGQVFRVSGSIQRFRIRGEAHKVLNARSSSEAAGQDLFDLEVIDDTGEVIAYIEGVSLSGRNGGIQAGQLSTESTPFMALEAR